MHIIDMPRKHKCARPERVVSDSVHSVFSSRIEVLKNICKQNCEHFPSQTSLNYRQKTSIGGIDIICSKFTV